MQWEGRRESENIEDVRGQGAPRMLIGGGLGTIILVVVMSLLGADPRMLLRFLQQGQPQAAPEANAPIDPDQEQLKRFVAVVLADTEDVWTDEFKRLGAQYEKPTLVMFTGAIQSGCGGASSAVGPFYCPVDHKVYIDLGFYDELKTRFRVNGDFAQAYVIAHEVGHHVQNLLGISDRVQRQRASGSEEESNRWSVRLELQADFLAGVFARRGDEMKGFLEKGDIDEAMRCASAIGDDALQKQAQGYAVPDSFTHGTSEQRMAAFMAGYNSHDLREMNKFVPGSL
jgi:predicted metalloprotease